MAAEKILANGWSLTIGGTAIGGLISFSMAGTKTDADMTDFDSNGNEEHLPASRGGTVQVESFYKEDPSTGARDAGQAKVVTSNAAVGSDAIEEYVLTSPAGTTHTFDGSVNVTNVGGGNTDGAKFNFEIKRTGAVVIA
jgi:hypothetical protein